MHRVMPRLTLAQAGSGALHSQQFPFPSNPKICPKTSRPPWEPPDPDVDPGGCKRMGIIGGGGTGGKEGGA